MAMVTPARALGASVVTTRIATREADRVIMTDSLSGGQMFVNVHSLGILREGKTLRMEGICNPPNPRFMLDFVPVFAWFNISINLFLVLGKNQLIFTHSQHNPEGENDSNKV
jgi:hypothetical protein